MLEKIYNPQDLKKLSIEQLNLLAEEIRTLLIGKIYTTGGHMGSNLGIVEATIALHYVFNSPEDKIIFDVSHQSYTHKILTGRKDAFIHPECYPSFSGFTTPSESIHDIFKVGHTSTSISLACGLAKARDLNKKSENIIAIIGDGALSGGEAYEGLNNASMLNSNCIIIVNDNEMSIAKNQGGLYDNLALLRKTKGSAPLNFFKTLGFDYYYLEEGNDLPSLIELFSKVKDCSHPVILHIHTLKGKGLEWAEQHKEKGHWVNKKSQIINPNEPTYQKITADFLLKNMEKDPTIVAISPATPLSLGLTVEFREKAKEQFVDVGICEEHSIAFASGLAKNHAKPFVLVSSSFLQRAYDQIQQDLAMNHTPVTILVFNGKIKGGDCTHSGQYDIPMLSHIPSLVCLAPTNKQEYMEMLKFALKQTSHPLVIRVPQDVVENQKDTMPFDEHNIFVSKIVHQGNRVAILALGSFFELGKQLANELMIQYGIDATLVNPVCYSHLDEQNYDFLKQNHDLIITLEDGLLDGGYGYKVANYYATSDIKVKTYGSEKNFNDLLSVEEIYKKSHLNVEQILLDIHELLSLSNSK